jgi:hypothetical protein
MRIIANAAVQCDLGVDAALRKKMSGPNAKHSVLLTVIGSPQSARTNHAKGSSEGRMGQGRLDHDAPRGCPDPVGRQALFGHAGLSAMR